MEVQPQVVQSFLDLRSGQEYRHYLHTFTQKTINIAQILGYLCKGEEAHPNRIAADLSITTAQMAVLLNHMEASGYIRRIPDETDHRKTIVILTPEGREHHRQANLFLCTECRQIHVHRRISHSIRVCLV